MPMPCPKQHPLYLRPQALLKLPKLRRSKAPCVMAPGAMNSSTAHALSGVSLAYIINPPSSGRGVHLPPSTRPCPLGRGPPRLLPIAGGGDLILFSTLPTRAGCPTQHAAINKTPHSGVHRASCPLRAGGGTTISSPPHSVGCLTKHATNKTPHSGCPPRLLPIAGGGGT